MELQKIRFEQAQAERKAYDQLHEKIGQHVELGDLPRSDSLLAETEIIAKTFNPDSGRSRIDARPQTLCVYHPNDQSAERLS